MSGLLTFSCHSIWTVDNRLRGSIPSELGALTSLTNLDLRTWIGVSCWHECHACSHFLAILFEQIKMDSRVPFRANSEHWRRWKICGSVRGLVCLVGMNVTLAHIFLLFYLIRFQWFDWWLRSDLLWWFFFVVHVYFWLWFRSCLQLLHSMLLMRKKAPTVCHQRGW
jgi:hypothetical protein